MPCVGLARLVAPVRWRSTPLRSYTLRPNIGVAFTLSQYNASHIVYKQPHNHQVILAIELDSKTEQIFRQARAEFPKSQFILLLDTMVIQNIRQFDSISGTLIRETEKGERKPFLEHVVIPKSKFSVLYLDEVPLSLKADEPQGSNLRSGTSQSAALDD